MAQGRSANRGIGNAFGTNGPLQGKTSTHLSGKTLACQDRVSEDALVSYSKEMLLSVRTLWGAQAAGPSSRLVTHPLSLLKSSRALIETSLEFDSMSCTQSGTSSQTSDASNVASPTSPVQMPAEVELMPPGLGLETPEEILGAELMKEIGKSPSTDAGCRAVEVAEDAAMASEAGWRAAACSWGRGGNYSQVLTRMRRAPGGKLSLAALRREAPHELRTIMGDGAAFATWLSHHTGLLEVCGCKGEEWVVLHTPQKKQLQGARQCFRSAESYAFGRTSSEVYAMNKKDAQLSQSQDAGLMWAGTVQVRHINPEYLTVADAHRLLARARMAQGAGHSPTDDRNLQARRNEFCPWWQQSDECPLSWQSEWDLAWHGKDSETAKVHTEDMQQQALRTRLNPKAAEFRPTISLAEYQARKLDLARCKAAQKRKQWESSEIPDVIPEEFVTCSEESTSGDEATGSDVTIVNDEDDSLSLASAATS